ncbi:hypothetical protein GCM10020366_20990 [Saccharopolyspora gregorii]|uniref:Uncharacterized protein n=1 Tax=Saccharopolyspora gregorii TaxID=33914 RepID=A0ABP6RIH6_9PSEU
MQPEPSTALVGRCAQYDVVRRAGVVMTVPILLGLVAWALVFGPVFLLWWLPGARADARRREWWR